MSRIQHPMSTAAVFDDIVYPVSFSGPESIQKEIDGAVTGSAGGAMKSVRSSGQRCWSVVGAHT